MNKTQGHVCNHQNNYHCVSSMVTLWYDFHIAHKFIAQLENLHGRNAASYKLVFGMK